jgi:hypothetical protein
VQLVLRTSLPIEGRVLAATGQPPVVSLYVAATPKGSSRAIALTTTNPDGTFALSGLAPGEYTISTSDPETGAESKKVCDAARRTWC